VPLYLVVLALAPALFLLFFIWLRDRYEREPLSLVLWTCAAGVLSALVALIIELALHEVLVTPFWQESALGRSLQAAVVEEVCKFLAVYLVVYKNPNLNEPMDGIVYAGAAALGFAALENLLYVSKFGAMTALYRAVLAVPAHFLFGVAMGYYLGRHRFGSRRNPLLTGPLMVLAPIALHLLFDVLAMNMGNTDGPGDLIVGALMYGLMAYLWFRGSYKINWATSRSPFRWRTRRRKFAQQAVLPIAGHCRQCGAGAPDGANYCYRCGAAEPLFVAPAEAGSLGILHGTAKGEGAH
jgi:RsiW-degrading membrane proteinase PrsW (M82 family)